MYFQSSKDLKHMVQNFVKKEIEVSQIKDDMIDIAKRRYKWSTITSKYAEVLVQ